ncbi:MAG: hypothetical protein KJ710_01720 [Candidatus Omnitrophica bacterium]|nr:hypothetical protein [Candidatus Omnitrophota bacterium]MBU1922969.1 hypothetical protein [Candidatus Omnitrophota bacterium]
MFSTPVVSALLLALVFVFIVDISFNLRRVNKNIIKLLKRYEDVHGAVKK